MSTPESPTRRLVNTGIRIDADLREKYVRAVKAKNPEFDLSKGIRMHMRETVAEYEADLAARENGRA